MVQMLPCFVQEWLSYIVDERRIFLFAWPSIEPFDFLHGDIFMIFLKAPHGMLTLLRDCGLFLPHTSFELS